MSAQLIDGKEIAKLEKKATKKRVQALVARGVTPGLATVLVGDDPASHVYVSSKRKTCARLGIESFTEDLPADTAQQILLDRIAALNANEGIHGILVQLPLPDHIDEQTVLEAVSPAKDVDGFHPENVGLLTMGRTRVAPCTSIGIMRLLERSGYELKGKNAVIVGRSNIVGKPTAILLMGQHATITICHSRTRDLPGVIRRADLVVAAMGKPEFIKGDWIAEGAAVIDVGINRVGEKLVGDVEFEAARERAGWITPVPGGVGPMTIAMLMENTVGLAEKASAGGPP